MSDEMLGAIKNREQDEAQPEIDETDSAPFRDINVIFNQGLWAKMSPSYSGESVIDRSRYDWTELGRWSIVEADMEEQIRSFQSEWLRTGVCPDPYVYEVRESQWATEIGAANFTHYLVLGHDVTIDVLAKGFTWKTRKVLHGW